MLQHDALALAGNLLRWREAVFAWGVFFGGCFSRYWRASTAIWGLYFLLLFF